MRREEVGILMPAGQGGGRGEMGVSTGGAQDRGG